MSLLTKVAKGVAYGDVSNSAIRNILTEISNSIGGSFTEQEMYDTLDFFNWRCPYTGKDLRPLITGKQGGYVTDHIYPQNRMWCGLNVKGNLIIVDKVANAQKRDQDVRTFLLNDTDVLTDLDLLGQTRQERLDKIMAFQKQCGYDPEQIRKVISPIMQKRYDEVRVEQEQCINDSLAALESINIYATFAKASVKSAKMSVAATKQGHKTISTQLVFHPADENQFKNDLLHKKKARFVLTYKSGVIKESQWDARDFDSSSKLKGNIQSRPFWRRRTVEGLVRVDVHID